MPPVWATSLTAPMSRKQWVSACRQIGSLVSGWDSEAAIGLTSLGQRVHALRLAVKMFNNCVHANNGRPFPAMPGFVGLVSTLLFACKVNVHSPRLPSLKKDLVAESKWAKEWREGVNKRDARSFMRFTGQRPAEFDEMLKLFEPLHHAKLAEAAEAANPSVSYCGRTTKRAGAPSSRGRGRPPMLSARDCLGLALRFTQTSCTHDLLAEEFGVTKSVLDRALWPAVETLLEVCVQIEDALCRYPPLWEGKAMEEGMERQHSVKCPFERDEWSRLAILAGDGTTFRIGNSSDDAEQRLFAHRSGGHRINVLLLWDAWGRIVHAVTNGLGTSNDYTLASQPGGMLDQHRSPITNPHMYAAFWDAGFQPAMHGGGDGVPASFRPLKDGEELPTDPEYRKAYLQFSTWCVLRRSMAEWGNNMLQRGFIRLLVPLKLAQRQQFNLLMKACIHLHNLRTRRAGWNQIQTTYRRHVDDNFREALLQAKAVGGVDGLHMYLANPGLNRGTTQVLGVEVPLGYSAHN